MKKVNSIILSLYGLFQRILPAGEHLAASLFMPRLSRTERPGFSSQVRIRLTDAANHLSYIGTSVFERRLLVDVFRAQALPQGTRVGAPSLGKWWYAKGTVAFSIPYGLGVRFDDYPYPTERDLHSFDDMNRELLEALVMLDE